MLRERLKLLREQAGLLEPLVPSAPPTRSPAGTPRAAANGAAAGFAGRSPVPSSSTEGAAAGGLPGGACANGEAETRVRRATAAAQPGHVAALAPGIDAAASPSTSRGPRPPLPAELRRMLGFRARARQAGAPGHPGTRPGAPSSPVAGLGAPDRELPGTELAPGLRLIECRCSWPPRPPALDTAFAGPRWTGGQNVDPATLLHFDTETTGLAGGTGTRAFMIGAAGWQDGALHLRQLFITSLAAERVMLEVFRSWLQPDTVLVSYNGKSYDAPLLATRYRLARMANPLAGLHHLDYLHPVRRRFRGVWENCRLATTEYQLLGVVREDDLPGSEAPRAWLDYLRGGSARNLGRVAAHNDQDLRSLAGLSAWWAAQ